ncbi:unnamed protein product [Absidia cylindrospora]
MVSSSSTLLFESGIMKIFDYDPIHDRYLTRTLQLPSLPLFSNLDIPLFEHTSKAILSSIKPSSSMTAPVNGDQKWRTATMSRFIECFELVDTTKATSSSSTIRSSHSTQTKKATNPLYLEKASRRCNSNPNLSKRNTAEELDPALVSGASSSSRKGPKRSLSNTFHVLSGLLPTKRKRRLDKKHDERDDDDNDSYSLLSSSSSSTSIRMAWQGTTWLDEMKTSSDFGSRQRLTSIDRSQPWWTATPPLSNYNVCVDA